MTTLTLDQAKTIVFSSSTADEALANLRDAGCDVVAHDSDCYSVHCGNLDIISFTQMPHSKFMSVSVGVVFFNLEQRKSFLESQQQPTDTVPAVSTVAEARPEFHPTLTCFCPACDYDQATAQKDLEAEFFHVNCSQCGLDADRDPLELCLSFDPDTEFHNLIGLFKVLGNVATRDESYQRAFVNNLLNNPHIHLHHLFDASLWMCVDAQLDTLDQIAPAHLKAGE